MIDRNIKTAVITGATGAIGTALCREMAEKGICVYAVVRPNSHRASALPVHENIHPVECDMESFETLAEKIGHKADAFYHFAWSNTTGAGRNDTVAQTKNIMCSITALRAAAALGCSVFIGAGSQAEYGRCNSALSAHTPTFPESGYGAAKLCAGQLTRIEAQKLGISHIWARILSVYGENDSPNTMISTVINKLKCGQVPALTAGEQMWDYLYSKDAAQLFRLVASHGADGKIYVFGSGVSLPLREYIEQLRDAIDPTLQLGFGQIPYSENQVMNLKADNRELLEDTGFKDFTPFSVGIRQTIENTV